MQSSVRMSISISRRLQPELNRSNDDIIRLQFILVMTSARNNLKRRVHVRSVKPEFFSLEWSVPLYLSCGLELGRPCRLKTSMDERADISASIAALENREAASITIIRHISWKYKWSTHTVSMKERLMFISDTLWAYASRAVVLHTLYRDCTSAI